MLMKKTAILLCIMFLFTACTGKKQSEELVIGVMPSMDYLPLAVAEREGYFKKLGLNIKIVKFYSANERDAAFQSGQVDGTVIDYTGAVLQSAGGISLKLVSRCDAPFYIIASQMSGITDIAGLKGGSVAVSQNTVIDYCVDMALRSADLNAGDINKVEINKIPLRFEMLRSGKVDATGLPDPLASRAVKAGDRVLATNTSLGFAITGIMFTDKAINTKSNQITKMYTAYNMAVDYMSSVSVKDISDILISEMGFSDDILPASMPAYSKAEAPSVDDLRMTAVWLSDKKLIDSSFDASAIVDSSLLPHD